MAFVIGICGGSGSGKSTLARVLAQDFGAQCLSMDHYYRSGADRPAHLGDNYDHPDNIAWPLLLDHVQSLKNGVGVERPVYDYAQGGGGVVAVPPSPVVILEGILIFHDPKLAALCDARLHLETDLSVQLARRLARDASERGIPEETTRAMWEATVAPMHRLFVAPQKERAHASIDSGQPMERMLAAARAALAPFLPLIETPAASRSARRSP